MPDVITEVAATYSLRQTRYDAPGPGNTLQIAQQDTRRVYLEFNALIGNDASVTTDPNPSTGNVFDIRGGEQRVFKFSDCGPLCQAAWFFGSSALNTPIIVLEVWKNG